MRTTSRFLALCACLFSSLASAQIDEDQAGAWYMYFWGTSFEDSRFGLQGDIQHRNWDLGGDLEQLLIRGGVYWSPENSQSRYTLGYAHIVSGEFGDGDAKSREDRIYQEALIPQLTGEKSFLTHRLRFEQRWVDGQDFRTRFRYFLAWNYPLNGATLGPGAWYLSLYNELFINLETDIGNDREVDHFDRNRLYAGFGYTFRDGMRGQFGYMQQKTDNVSKGQWQFSLFHTF
ncbi:MAG: DUF2490 domain-containing protein [Candidatus Rariloculaceae bacterium]